MTSEHNRGMRFHREDAGPVRVVGGIVELSEALATNERVEVKVGASQPGVEPQVVLVKVDDKVYAATVDEARLYAATMEALLQAGADDRNGAGANLILALRFSADEVARRSEQ